MAISKIILNGVTQMDVTQDTVTASTLMSGETAHDASGVQITGTAAGSNTFTLEYQNSNGVWSFTPTYADIKAAVQQNKVIDYTSFGDPALGGKYGSGYTTNVTFNGVSFTEAVRFYLEDFTFGGVSLVYYGYSSGQLQIQSKLEYLEPQGTLNITTNGTHNVSSYASANVNVSGGGDYSLIRCYVSSGGNTQYAKMVGATSSTGIVSIMEIPTTQTAVYVPRIGDGYGILVSTGNASYYWARMQSGTGATVISNSGSTTNIQVTEDAIVQLYVSIRD